MHIISCHNNTDFDALASMVAASFIYPEALRILPTQLQPGVQEFVSVHWDILRLQSRKGLDLSHVRQLTVTDTANWERLDNMKTLAGQKDLRTIVWDHHPGRGSIEASELHQEETGAAVTLLLEEMKARDCAFSPVHATLFLLGIYDDTGSLSFPSTTARDVHMAGFMLENGADLHVVAAYQDSALDDRHMALFQRMLGEAQTISLGSLKIGISSLEVEKGLTMLPSVVHQFKDIQGLDAAFGIFPMGPEKMAIIARSSARELDLGAMMRRLGGGGHPGAGSAILKGSLEIVHQQVLECIHSTKVDEASVRHLMTPVPVLLSAGNSVRQAADILKKTGKTALPVVDDENSFLGTFSEKTIASIRQDRQWEQRVTAMLNRDVPSVAPDDTLRHALLLMSRSETGLLPVILKGKLAGEITRASIILNMYSF
ncbi:nanoRNase/pAp phosphatase (c-di-AMP/oligoRNAs hydrolase) [Desulfobotulus alkaliphilus]|uniref:NanoRNase/pAp phosphatase (C-di-AMP/oligoRNAs hydrolase) n=1 Tax=Desulfobotulus alkaliphilus TaxID=622671 RepID=A0A562RYT1_9BACT|nr:CBS domain-containing protein [Desulfobotulus alkaliphilus]TWI74013.1 nanoRNase/pAp phosphatase (c-di-AMP/oligoRNAs hydrolase) [Desulfobotulus alkaliphilus]